MEIVYILIPLSLLLLGIAAAIFIWAINNGQYDDLDSPGWRILADERRKSNGRRTDNKPKNST